MSYNPCSGNFSPRSLGGYLCSPGSSWGSSYPSNLAYSTDLCSPSSCHLGSSLSSGCQETCHEPTRCQTSCVVSSPCQVPCYCLRTSRLCSPCLSTYSVSQGSGSHRGCSVGCGCRSCFSLGFRSLRHGVCGVPSLDYRTGFCHPTYYGFRNLRLVCYQPICGSNFYRLI